MLAHLKNTPVVEGTYSLRISVQHDELNLTGSMLDTIGCDAVSFFSGAGISEVDHAAFEVHRESNS